MNAADVPTEPNITVRRGLAAWSRQPDWGSRNRNEHAKAANERINEAAVSPSVCQTSYDLMCRLLRRVLRDAVQSGPGAADGIGSVECQAVATLYMLLMDHPIDRRGRCRSCRRPGAVFGSRWRRCRVYGKASVWLHQPDEALLLRLLIQELGLPAASRPAMCVAPGGASASDPDDTDMLPAIAVDRPTEPLQTPGNICADQMREMDY